MKAPDIVNDLTGSTTKAVPISDGRLITESLAKMNSVTVETVLGLISRDDDSELAKAVRLDLRDGGPRLLGIDLCNGYVTSVITQPSGESTGSFVIVSEETRFDGGGYCHYIGLRRIRKG
jgi:hypothetical protein